MLTHVWQLSWFLERNMDYGKWQLLWFLEWNIDLDGILRIGTFGLLSYGTVCCKLAL